MNKMSNITLKTFRKIELSDLTLDLVRLLNETTEQLNGEVLIPRTNYRYVIRPFISSHLPNGDALNLIRIRRTDEKRRIIGIDSTCIPIAESRNGLILAARASMVYSDFKRFNVIRVGPLIIYVNEDTSKYFRKQLIVPDNFLRKAHVEVRYARRLILGALEKAMLAEAVESDGESIILLDGSLKQPNVELRARPFKRIVRRVLSEGGILAGVSKRSELFKWCFNDFSKLALEDPPVAVRVQEAGKYIRDLWGEVYFTLLKRNGVPLRVDVISIDRPEKVFSLIYSNDLLRGGYPETLRKAHIYSSFLSSERMSLRLLLKKLKSRLITCEREREAFFGPFNRPSREWEES